jgi:ATP-dependent protease HslVU (ClpYQ) ATPase subunit
MLPPDDEARSKMTPAAVVERLDQHIIGQVRKETIGHSLILIRVNLMSITQSWTWI